MGIVPKAEMEPLMQMILSFLSIIVLYLNTLLDNSQYLEFEIEQKSEKFAF